MNSSTPRATRTGPRRTKRRAVAYQETRCPSRRGWTPPAMSRRDGRVERSCIESTFAPIRFGLTRIRGSHDERNARVAAAAGGGGGGAGPSNSIAAEATTPEAALRARDSCCCFRRRRFRCYRVGWTCSSSSSTSSRRRQLTTSTSSRTLLPTCCDCWRRCWSRLRTPTMSGPSPSPPAGGSPSCPY
jgi:hypothetical protein